jgi:tetratricopeptide (TPR) repeat protein
MAETEKQKKLAVLSETAERLAHKEADRNAEEAKKSQEIAGQQAKVAMETVYQVVTTADEKLRPFAELGPLRKELLQLAMKQLDQISKELVASGKADQTMGIALQRMGRFYDQMGETQKQVQVMERSLEIFDRLMVEHPEAEWNKENAAISHDALAEIGRENWADPDKIVLHFNRSLELRKDLVAEVRSEKPSLFRRQQGLAISYVNRAGLALDLGDPAKALEYAREALVHSEAAVAADPKKEYERREMLSSAYYYLGWASSRLAKPGDAQKYLQMSLNLRQDWAQANPRDAHVKQELGRTLDTLGDVETELHLYPVALEHYQKSLAVFQEVLQKAPIPEVQWYRANVEYHLGTVYRLLKNEKAALEYFSSCAKTREELFKSDPNNAQRKVELLLVYARLGKYREAAKMAQEIADFAPQHPGKLLAAASGYALCSSAVSRTGTLGDRNSGSPDDETLKRIYLDKALATLRQALASGYKDFQGLRTNPDLEPLQSLDEYKQLLNQLVRK